MALKDVKQYYYKMLGVYVESKNDLADYEQAFRDGNITEDQLTDVKADIDAIKANLDRIQYIMYLFNLPNRRRKKINVSNDALIKYFNDIGVDVASIEDENKSALDHLRKELKRIKGD